VRAESEGPGKGTTFVLTFPTVPTADAPPGPMLRTLSTGPLRVLIVEDNRDAAESLRDLLELSGCTVALAFSGPEALAAAPAFRPEVVLCDLGLPGMTGFEVGAKLREEPTLKNTRLIAVSGYGQEEDQRRSRAAGFDLHLTKPVEFEELWRLLPVRAGTQP
jgi:two-component system CheB/CheR fusion protein